MTTNPAWSFTVTGSLPHAAANATAVAIVSSDAVIGRTISTNDIAGAGLKKWIPQTRSGRPVSMASSTTGSVDVFVATIVPSGQIRSSSVKRCFLTARSSTTDSTTRSTSASASRSVAVVTRPRICSRSSSVRFPFSTCRASDFSRRTTVASALDWLRLRRTTWWPVAAATSAMPEPMIPEPTIPTRVTVMDEDVTPLQKSPRHPSVVVPSRRCRLALAWAAMASRTASGAWR